MGRRKTERGAQGWGTVARWAPRGSPGEPVALAALHPARLEGRVWERVWERGNGKGASAEIARAARLRRPGKRLRGETRSGRSGKRPGAPGGAAAGSRGSARETKVSEPSPSPPSAPRPRAGERDPCPDPAPRPARAITKETRPPALPAPRRLKTDPSAGTGR